jgi:hypothetical protein
MSYGDGGFWFTQPTGYGALDLQGSSYGMADRVPPAKYKTLDLSSGKSNAARFTPSAVKISDPEPEWECIGCNPQYQPDYQTPVAEEKEGMKDWQKVAAGMAVAALVAVMLRKR